MPFRQADRLPLLLAEIITVLDRHTIQLQRLNNKVTHLVMNLERHTSYCNEMRQQYAPNDLNFSQEYSYLALAESEAFERLQAQNAIKDELLFLARQLYS